MISKMRWRANLAYPYYGDDIELRAVSEDGNTCVAMITCAETIQGSSIPCAAQMDRDTAQLLMDSLWDCGVRPTEGSGSAGALAATEKHLGDMKQIAFHALKIERGPNQ